MEFVQPIYMGEKSDKYVYVNDRKNLVESVEEIRIIQKILRA